MEESGNPSASGDALVLQQSKAVQVENSITSTTDENNITSTTIENNTTQAEIVECPMWQGLPKLGPRAIRAMMPQILADGPFDATDIKWGVFQHNKARVEAAVIPYDRVNDFKKGELARPDYEMNLYMASKKRPRPLYAAGIDPKNPGDAQPLHCLYEYTQWCSYGPQDFRDKVKDPLKNKKRPNRERRKRGCQLHYIVKTIHDRPHLALITYVQSRHLDKNGLPCHGPDDPTSERQRSRHGMHLSENIRHWVNSLLYVGVGVAEIHNKHNQIVTGQQDDSSLNIMGRDAFLTKRDIFNQRKRVDDPRYRMHEDETLSVQYWVEKNRVDVFLFNREPFTLGIMTRWQAEQVVKHGHNNVLAMDSTFSTNKYKYPLYTILVFNAHQYAIPVAWVIAKNAASETVAAWLHAFRQHILTFFPVWKPSSFLVDDALAEIVAIWDIFECPIILCIWHICRGWLKKIIKYVCDSKKQANMFKALGSIMHLSSTHEDATDRLLTFYQDFSEETDFIQYFKDQWEQQLSMWVRAYRNFQHSNQGINTSIESYHMNIKQYIFREVGRSSIRRMDWLIGKLTIQVHSYYWFTVFVKTNGFAQNFVSDHIKWTAWESALNIPDSDVSYDLTVPESMRIKSQSGQSGVYYTLCNPGSEMACCECTDALRGDICKHMAKAYMYIKSMATTIAADLPVEAPAVDLTLFPDEVNFRDNGNGTVITEGNSDEQNENLIDEHTKQWAIDEFSKAIDYCISMKCNKTAFMLEISRCASAMKWLGDISGKGLQSLRNLERDNSGTGYSRKRLTETHFKRSAKKQARARLQPGKSLAPPPK